MLGYSVLQLLGYGVSAISVPLVTFQDVLSRKITDFKHGRQNTTTSEVEVVNNGDDCQVIELDEEHKLRNYADWEENFKLLEHQIRQIKTRMESYEKQGGIANMKSKIPIRIPKNIVS